MDLTESDLNQGNEVTQNETIEEELDNEETITYEYEEGVEEEYEQKEEGRKEEETEKEEEEEEEEEVEEEEKKAISYDSLSEDFHFIYEGTARDNSYFANSMLEKLGQRALTNSTPICSYYERLLLKRRIIILDNFPEKITKPTVLMDKTSDRLSYIRHNWKKEREAEIRRMEKRYQVPRAALKAVASARLQQLCKPYFRKTIAASIQPPKPLVSPAALKFIADERIRQLSVPKLSRVTEKYIPPEWVPIPIHITIPKVSPRLDELAKPTHPRQKYVPPPMVAEPAVKPSALSYQATERINELCKPRIYTEKYEPPKEKRYVRLSTVPFVCSERLAVLAKPKPDHSKIVQ